MRFGKIRFLLDVINYHNSTIFALYRKVRVARDLLAVITVGFTRSKLKFRNIAKIFALSFFANYLKINFSQVQVDC